MTVACGSLDVSSMLINARQLAERLPYGEFVVLDGIAHLPSLEAPELVAELITRALGA